MTFISPVRLAGIYDQARSAMHPTLQDKITRLDEIPDYADAVFKITLDPKAARIFFRKVEKLQSESP
jgi:hypothetical protein